MDNISLSASLAVRRIIDGDTLSIWFTTNGIPLHQGLNPNDFTATPKWTEGGDHPVITPNVSSARKNAVSLLTHTWKYNSVEITFASGIGWVKSTNFDGKFKLNTKDGTLAIIGDLATKDNQDADVLEYTGMASVGSASYEMTNSIGVLVTMLGSSAFFGGIEASSTMLGVTDKEGNETTTAILKFWLKNAGGDVSKYSVKLYRGNETTPITTLENASSGGSITIHRDKTGDDDKLYVDSHQLFIAEFIVDGTIVYRAGVSIDDNADVYQLVLSESGGVNASTNSVVTPKVLSTATGTAVTIGKGTIKYYILKSTDLTVVRSTSIDFANNAEFIAATLTITAADTKDGNGNEWDLTVNCDLTAQVLS